MFGASCVETLPQFIVKYMQNKLLLQLRGKLHLVLWKLKIIQGLFDRPSLTTQIIIVLQWKCEVIYYRCVSFSCTFQTDNPCLHKWLSKQRTGSFLGHKMLALTNGIIMRTQRQIERQNTFKQLIQCVLHLFAQLLLSQGLQVTITRPSPPRCWELKMEAQRN